MRERLIEAARHDRVEPVKGQCLCGAVSLEIASRHAGPGTIIPMQVGWRMVPPTQLTLAVGASDFA
jgi:hypothetical protein